MKSISFNYTNGDLVGLHKARNTISFRNQFCHQISTAAHSHDFKKLLSLQEEIAGLIQNSLAHHYHKEIYDLFELTLLISKHLSHLRIQSVIKFLPVILFSFIHEIKTTQEVKL